MQAPRREASAFTVLLHPCPPGAEGKHVCPRCSSEDTKVCIAAALSALLTRTTPPDSHNQPAAGVRRSAALLCTENTREPDPAFPATLLQFCYYNNYNIKQPRFYCRVRLPCFACGPSSRYMWRSMQGAAWRLLAGGCSPAAVRDRAAIHPCFYLSHPGCRRASGIGRQEARCAMCPPAPAAARARRQQRLLRPRKRAARPRRPHQQQQQAAAAQPPPCLLLWAVGKLAWCRRWAA